MLSLSKPQKLISWVLGLRVVCGPTMVGVQEADWAPGSWSRTPIGTDTGGCTYTHPQSGTDAGAALLFTVFSLKI